jgi:hypothetical protein
MVIGEDPSASGVERRAVVLVDRQAIGNNTSEHIRTDGPVNEQEAAPVLITGTHSVWTSRWRNSQSVGNGHAAADLIQQIIRERKTAD